MTGCISLLSIVIMDGSVQLFQLVQKFYQTMGISSSQTINWRNSSFLLAMFLQSISLFAFLLFEAKSILERGLLVFIIITDIYSISDFSITLWRRPEILKLIKLCEKFIEKSMFFPNQTVNLSIPFHWIYCKKLWFSFRNRITKWSTRFNFDEKIHWFECENRTIIKMGSLRFG